jgi:ribosomal protein S6--L-glutamate ligase
MRFCFIVEANYRLESMPTVIARQLLRWGHAVDILEPSKTVTSLCDLTQQAYDAYVLKTVSDGPGLCILEAAEAVGIPTINNSRSIRLVRDKSLCAAFAYAQGLPVPRSYFVVNPQLLKKIPQKDYPLVVKPTNGSSGRGIYLVNSPAQLATLKIDGPSVCFFLAQRYVENPGYDIKLYVIGKHVYAVARESPLHPDVELADQLLPLKPEWLRLARRVGEVFGLDIYGLDVLEAPTGPVVVDINDFPSFGHIPRVVSCISNYILYLAKEAKLKRQEQPHERRALHPASPQRLAMTGVRKRTVLAFGISHVTSTEPIRTARS